MTVLDASTGESTPRPAEPADAVRERLNDPAVAAALVTLLDSLELVATGVKGLNEFLQRGDTIADSISAGVAEMRAVGWNGGPGLPSPAELGQLVGALAQATPVVTQVLDSSMVSPETVALLSMVSDAAAEGTQRAMTESTSVRGVRATIRTLKDPEVARGLGLLVEISRSLGRRLATNRD